MINLPSSFKPVFPDSFRTDPFHGSENPIHRPIALNPRRGNPNSRPNTPDSGLKTPVSRPKTPDSGLKTPVSRPNTPTGLEETYVLCLGFLNMRNFDSPDTDNLSVAMRKFGYSTDPNHPSQKRIQRAIKKILGSSDTPSPTLSHANLLSPEDRFSAS